MLKQVTAPKTTKLVLGDIPSSGGPDCSAHCTQRDDVQACSMLASRSVFDPGQHGREAVPPCRRTRYVDVTPWFCAKTCSPSSGTTTSISYGNHVAVGYSRFLEGVLHSVPQSPPLLALIHR